MSGRRVHPGSGRIYHVEFNKPKQEGLDDVTSEALVQREDDQEDTVRHRLSIYHEQTKPLVGFYQNMSGDNAPVYHKIAGVGAVEEIKARSLAALS